MGSVPTGIDIGYNPGVLGSHCDGSPIADFLAIAGGALANLAWQQANMAVYMPFLVRSPGCVAKLLAWRNGVTISGNIDVGIYDELGNRLVSSGSTLQAGSQLSQSVDITDTPLPPGTYFTGMALDNTTATIYQYSLTSNAPKQGCGMQAQATAFPLPNPATFSNPIVTSQNVPHLLVITDFTAI